MGKCLSKNRYPKRKKQSSPPNQLTRLPLKNFVKDSDSKESLHSPPSETNQQDCSQREPSPFIPPSEYSGNILCNYSCISTYISSNSLVNPEKNNYKIQGTDSNQQQQLVLVNGEYIRGLRNLGNTCFMNSILQCLSQTLLLREFYVSDEYKQYLNKRGDLSFAFKRVMLDLRTAKSSVDPSKLKKQVARVVPIFSDYRQHDAHEFMRFLLNELHEEINRASVEGRKSPADNETLREACARHLTWEDSRISELFGGMLRSEVCCCQSWNQFKVYIPFMDIALPIPNRTDVPSPNITDCFRMLTTEETLDGGARPYCNACERLTKSTKKLSLSNLPKYLVIQLKRFSYYPTRTKLTTRVEFDDTWRLVDSSYQTYTYSLYGIASHWGGLDGGHYIAYCQHEGEWRCFNDTTTYPVNWEHVRNQEAYILFYKAVEIL